MPSLSDRRVILQPFDPGLAAAWGVEPPNAALPLADWIAGQATLHRSPEEREKRPSADAEVLGLVAGALAQLADGVRRHRCHTPAEYAAFGALSIPGGDLERVVIPAGRRHELARLIDDEGVAYLLNHTDCGRLCAAAIFALADRADQLGAETVGDFRRIRDGRARD